LQPQRDLSRNPLYQVTFNKLIVQPASLEAIQAGLEMMASEIGGMSADIQQIWP